MILFVFTQINNRLVMINLLLEKDEFIQIFINVLDYTEDANEVIYEFYNSRDTVTLDDVITEWKEFESFDDVLQFCKEISSDLCNKVQLSHKNDDVIDGFYELENGNYLINVNYL